MRTSVTNSMRKRTLQASKPERSKVKKKKKKELTASSSMSTTRKKPNKPVSRAKKAKKAAKYKEAHAVGRRASSQFVTYSQDGRLFYDLYTRYTPYTSHKTPESKPSPSTPTSTIASSPSKLRSPMTATGSKHKPRSSVVRSKFKKSTVTRNNKNSLPQKVNVTQTAKRNYPTESKCSKPTLQKHSTKTPKPRRESAKMKLERKLKRELGVDFIPNTQTVSKRLASINAVAIINAVTRDTTKRVPPRSKDTSNRRYSVETVPCIDEKVELIHEATSIHSDDALTEPMSLSPQHKSPLKKPNTSSTVRSPVVSISPLTTEATTSQASRKRKRPYSTAFRRKSSPPKETPVTTASCQEMVSTRPQTSAIESYHSEQLVPLGSSSFGFHQITTQVIRYAQPDCPLLMNAGFPVPLHAGPAVSSGLANIPTFVRAPGDLGPGLNSSEFFNTNRAHTFITSISLPVLTPMPAVTHWPTLINPYNHITQAMPTQIHNPNTTVLVPSFIPLQTQFQYPVLPNTLNPQLEHPPTFLSPSLFQSPVCNLPHLQPLITPSFGLLQPVQSGVSYPSLYYPSVTPTYAIRDGSVPLSVPHPAMTVCTPSPLGIQLPVHSQPFFTVQAPSSIHVSLPAASQNSQPSAFTINSLAPLPSLIPAGASDQVPPPAVSKTPLSAITLPGDNVAVSQLSNPCTPLGTPMQTSIRSSEPNDNVINHVTCGVSPNVVSADSVTECSPIATTTVAISAGSKVHLSQNIEPANVCSVDSLNNAWQWEGSSFTKAVFCRSDAPPVIRTCFGAIRHRRDGMVIRERDCVLLCSGPDRSTAPHVAKITALFADPTTADTKMMALLWYYRPEHVGCAPGDLVPNELYASRHCDTNPVDCIEDKAYVLTASAFARFMAQLKYRQSAYPRAPLSRVVPIRLPKSTSLEVDGISQDEPCLEASSAHVSWTGLVPDNANPSNVFLCRGVYDYRLKRVCRNVNFHVLPIHSHFLTNRLRNNRPPSAHPPVEDNTDEASNRSAGSSPPKPQTISFPDPPAAVLHDRSVPSKDCERLGNQSASQDPSPADSPSLCICLPDSPESIVSAPVKPHTTTVYPSPTSTPPMVANSSSPPTTVERSSTPLKSRSSVSTTNTAVSFGIPSPTSNATSSHIVPLPTQATSQARTSGNGNDKPISTPSYCNTTSVLTTPISATPYLIPASSNPQPVWISAHQPMPLFESSVLETSADLSVNWAEHGEQIALSLDCRAVRPPVLQPAHPIPGVLSSHPIFSAGPVVSIAHNLMDNTHMAVPTMANTVVWSSTQERPTAMELFEQAQMPIHGPNGATGTTSSNVSNPRESDAPRLVML